MNKKSNEFEALWASIQDARKDPEMMKALNELIKLHTGKSPP